MPRIGNYSRSRLYVQGKCKKEKKYIPRKSMGSFSWLTVAGRLRDRTSCEVIFLVGPVQKDVRKHQAMRTSDQIRSDQIRSDQIRSDQIRSEQIRSDQIWSDQIRSDQIRSDQIRSDQIRSDQIRSDQIRSDQIRSDPMEKVQGIELCEQEMKGKGTG